MYVHKEIFVYNLQNEYWKNIFKNGNQITKLHWPEVEVVAPR